jgi:uncharacterized protein
MKKWLLGMLAGAAGLAAAALYAWLGERTRVQLDRFTIPTHRAGLPPDGLIILHLSDLHCRAQGKMQDRKLARLGHMLAGQQYDIVALTGDLIHDEPGFKTALAFIDTLHPRLGTFSVPGNHDYCESSLWGLISLREFGQKLLANEQVHLPVSYHDVSAMQRELEEHGVQPLVNRSIQVKGDGLDLWFAGVDDLWEGRPDPAAALAGVPEDALLVMLAHNPDAWLQPCIERADLVLSGHVHGGQISLPLLGALHTQGTHLSRRRAAGWFMRGRSRLFVSRGVGESLPLRLGVLPQAALIRILPVT